MQLCFPNNFTWGCATSAYQIEGAWNADGKGPSIWDLFCMLPGKIHENENGNLACDHYHRIDEDVALMKAMGLKAYRFSISWPRILPAGRGTPNAAGIRFYDHLINRLIEANIEPWVTLYHWDLPATLEFEIGGWLSADIPEIFAAYASVCFQHFGDRVNNWITLNEPWVVAVLGYGTGTFAPGRISSVAPYRVGHNLLKAHALAVKQYRDLFQRSQGGQIGISNNCDWREPLTQTPADVRAADRALEFFLAWFADPLYFGQYPQTMIRRLGSRLPEFSSAERDLIMGSTDFFGLNHYTTMYASDTTSQPEFERNFGNGGTSIDQQVQLSVSPDWPMTDTNWPVVPWGCGKLLEWIAKRYKNPPIYLTENGCAYPDPLDGSSVEDPLRIDFFNSYLREIHEAMKHGVDVRGYFAWSLMDNFEWASGYSKQYGLVHIDRNSLKRTLKASAHWYASVIRDNGILD